MEPFNITAERVEIIQKYPIEETYIITKDDFNKFVYRCKRELGYNKECLNFLSYIGLLMQEHNSEPNIYLNSWILEHLYNFINIHSIHNIREKLNKRLEEVPESEFMDILESIQDETIRNKQKIKWIYGKAKPILELNIILPWGYMEKLKLEWPSYANIDKVEEVKAIYELLNNYRYEPQDLLSFVSLSRDNIDTSLNSFYRSTTI